jgi:hypothetical protein
MCLMHRDVVIATVVGSLAFARPALAQISSVDASTMVQSTASDTDALFLGILAGFTPLQTLSYTSTNTDTSWLGSLSGTFQSSSVILGYTGDLSSYPAGPITWSSTGVYGSLIWAGSGTAMITTTGSTFSLALTDSATIGSSTYSINETIPGTTGGSGPMFGNAMNPEVGTGTLTVNGNMLADAQILNSYEPLDKNKVSDVIIAGVPMDVTPGGAARNFMAFTGDMLDSTVTVSVVPEPSSIVMFLLGTVAAGPFLLRRTLARKPQ